MSFIHQENISIMDSMPDKFLVLFYLMVLKMMMTCSFICICLCDLCANTCIRFSRWCACVLCVRQIYCILSVFWMCFMGTMRKSGKWAEQLPVSQQLKHINFIECLVFCWWCYCYFCRCWCCCWARLSSILWVAVIFPRTPIPHTHCVFERRYL